MLCGKWKSESVGIGILRTYPVVDEDDKWLNYVASLLSASLFERMQEQGISTVYKHFWNGQKVLGQELDYLNTSGSGSFIVKEINYLVPARFTTKRDKDSFWRGCFVEEDGEQKSVSILDVLSGQENKNQEVVYQNLTILIEQVNRFFNQVFNDWLELDRLDLWFAVDEKQKVYLVSFDFQLSFQGAPIVLNYEYEDKTAMYPRTISMKMFCSTKTEYEVKQWTQSSRYMYWNIVDRLLKMDKTFFLEDKSFYCTAKNYVDMFYMIRRP